MFAKMMRRRSKRDGVEVRKLVVKPEVGNHLPAERAPDVFG